MCPPVTWETTVSELTDSQLNSLVGHAEYGHLEGRDYEQVVTLVSEVRRLRDGIRAANLAADAFGVESTHWKRGNLHGSSPGRAIPEDCDQCEVTIDSDVYEAMTDLWDLIRDDT